MTKVEMSVCISMKTSVRQTGLDLTGTTSAQQEKRWIGDWRVTAVCVFAFGVCREGLFFYDAICTAARKDAIVRWCKPLVNDHCAEVLMTIPFELPTLLFVHGLTFCSMCQGKQECNGHILAEQLCARRLPWCFACVGLWWSRKLD